MARILLGLLQCPSWGIMTKKRGKILTIEFKVTTDSRVLGQYYSLRGRCFREELGLSGFDGSEEEQDREGLIFLALQDGNCVGGARIASHITLTSQLELLEIDQSTCCMWERFVMDPTARSIDLVREYIANLIQISLDSGYQNAMVLSSLRNARFYRRCHTALGVGFQIHRPVPYCAQGAFAGLEHYLSIAYLEQRQPLRLVI